MVTTGLATNDVIDMHLTFICTTQLAHATITLEHAFTLFAVSSAVKLINSHFVPLLSSNLSV
jgi:hypothetical protein